MKSICPLTTSRRIAATLALLGVLLCAGCAVKDAKDLDAAPLDPMPEIGEGERRAGNVVVLADFSDADTPSSRDESTSRCRTRVWLESVYYGGDDVGSEWEYVVSVDDENWKSERRELPPGELDRVERRVLDSTSNGCGQSRSLALTVRAREFDFFLDETAVGFGFALLPCMAEPTRTTLQVLVPVVETPSYLEPRPTAALVFVFRCETRCVD